MQTVYFISGLGADSRVFQYLDLSFCNPVFVEWLVPLRNETIANYAVRMKKQMQDEEPVIVGFSFGGMIAVEIAKQYPVKQLVLLSSAKTAKEIPYYLRMLRYFPLHKLISASVLKYANSTAYRMMGVNTRKDKVLFTQMFRDANDQFVSWAINQIIHWKNDVIPEKLVHIHGTADIMLPFRFIKTDHQVKDGEHLMLILNAENLSGMLRKILRG